MAAKAVATFLVLLLGLNSWGWQSDLFAWFVAAAYLVLASYLVGGRFGSHDQGWCERLAWGALAWSALVSVAGALVLYLGLLTPQVILTLAALLPWLGVSRRPPPLPPQPPQPRVAGLGVAYVALAAVTIFIIAASSTSEAIRTPWQVVPGVAFISYGLAVGCFLLLTHYARHPGWLVPLFLTSLSVLALVYPLGYGFDPFIHQASEKLIQATGTLAPKPPYYLGQYGLIVTLAELARLPVALADTWLVPLAAALALPLTLWRALARLPVASAWRLTVPLVALATVGSAFTYTTPQALANLMALVAVCAMAARLAGDSLPQRTVWLTVAAALATHPLTGLPLGGVAAVWWLSCERVTFFGARQRLARVAAVILTTLAVPLAFVALSWLKPGAASVAINPDPTASVERLGASLVRALPALPRFTSTVDAVEVAARPLALLVVLLAGLGWWRAPATARRLRFLAWAASMPAASYLIMAIAFTFPGLPPHEQQFYTERLWLLALTVALPLALVGACVAGAWVRARLPHALPWVVGASLALTAGFYLTYPRFDRWHRDTAYNTTPTDVAAVRLIEEAAAGTPYVVLANQAVAAAAVREYGFARYYQGHFYYPVPTGTNPLYEAFLNAAERGLPTRTTVEAAAAQLGVPTVFLVLNRYWADFLTLAPVAAREADARWQVADDRAQVFRYDF